ncbi:hypothetical protein [Microbacterium indicum]|uniref:hypothetical protein n=1 Tax=Microbacterium indicum TaxID=358100 RepID=UPI0003F5625D|nr:hypothetical protein [Microbacterium indicum]
MAQKKPLSERIREAGGLYQYVNSRLIRYAGPPTVGPYAPVDGPPCSRCGHVKREHVEVDGVLHCPESQPA